MGRKSSLFKSVPRTLEERKELFAKIKHVLEEKILMNLQQTLQKCSSDIKFKMHETYF